MEIFWKNDVSVTSFHAILSKKWSSAISIADQCIPTEANRKQKCQYKGNWILYKMAISDVKILDFDPKNFKSKCFWEKCSKIKN